MLVASVQVEYLFIALPRMRDVFWGAEGAVIVRRVHEGFNGCAYRHSAATRSSIHHGHCRYRARSDFEGARYRDVAWQDDAMLKYKAAPFVWCAGPLILSRS